MSEQSPSSLLSETTASSSIIWNKVLLLLGALILSGLALIGITQRNSATAEQKQLAAYMAIPTVSVITPALSDTTGELILPGQLQPQNRAAIYAQTNGYIEQWLVDLGDNVTQGQLLATLAAPELEHQLAQAKADHATAVAELNNARNMAERATQLSTLNSGAIAKETVDQRVQEAEAKAALVAAAVANIKRLESQQSFTRLTAPFSGVVTSRAAQIGDLVVSGNANSTPLFTIADTAQLRVYIRVPQNYASLLKTGQQAEISLPNLPEQRVAAQLIRSAGAVNSLSGSVLMELQVNNSDGRLLPGAYAQVHFPLQPGSDLIRIPGSAILFRDARPAVAVLDTENRVTLKTVTLGRDEGSMVQILTGISATDRIITTPPDAVRNGDLVRVLERADVS